MTVLRQCLADYLSVRHALGFKLDPQSHQLGDFITFMETVGASFVTTQLALMWVTRTTDSMHQRANRLGAVRAFARYLQAIDARTEVPPSDVLPRRNGRASPHIYNDAEISALLAATRTIRSPMGRSTYATLIGLLSVTGMRPGEAISLDQGDVDWDRGLLTVRRTKFGKSREVALHPTTIAALETYGRLRDGFVSHPRASAFFVSQRGTPLVHMHVDDGFRQLARRAGFSCPAPRYGPRLQDFRHTFAVRTLLDWYRDGLDVTARLPLLSTYLGHVNPRTTYWYLSATPELLTLASERLQRGAAGGLS